MLEILTSPRNVAGNELRPWIPLRNPENSPEASSVNVPVKPVDEPSSLVTSNVTFAELDDPFAMANPVRVEPIPPLPGAVSTYIRKAVPVGFAGTLASVIVTLLFRYEKTVKADGVAVPDPGVTRTEPVEGTAAPAV